MIADVQVYTYVNGFISDPSGAPLTGVSITLIEVSTGNVIVAPLVLSSDEYFVETDQYNASELAVIFKKQGFKTRTISLAELDAHPDINLLPGSSGIQPWMIGLVIGAVLLHQKGKKNKVGKLNTTDLFPIFLLVGGIIAFSLIKKILETFGLWDSRDTKDLDHASTDPTSFWNPNYWQTIKPADKDWTFALTESQASNYAMQIYFSFGAFNDDEDRVIGIFKSMRTKANVSFIAYIFQRGFGQDLLKFLRGGNWPEDRLSDSDVNEINQYVNKLPNY